MLPPLATIPPPPFNGLQLGPLDVRLYGILIALGAYLALRLTVRRYERLGGDAEAAEKAALVALAGGFIGARIGYVIPRLDYFVANPQDVLAIWQGGLTLFGGLAGGSLAGVWYLRRKAMDVPAFAHAIAPALPLAQAIGRWGNYFNQELYGRPTDLPWALQVEAPFRRPGFEQFATFHPTFLYESLWNVTLVLVLLAIDRTGRIRRGGLIFVYLIGYGIGRAWIEALRIDTAERYLGWSRNNWVALLVIVIGVVGLAWWQRRPVAEPTETADAEHELTSGDDHEQTSGEVDEQPSDEDHEQGSGSHAANPDEHPADQQVLTDEDAPRPGDADDAR
ncbi:prolipoprotein diacylglyceryl transferase [Egicoccus sp. AB-alg2]|uniref:prolipoprotein diacylglyceryl transferase n=1 Tax=Egicoccus sp. AB-alg2 TaxID=3242693 RepID=UPI00359E6578